MFLYVSKFNLTLSNILCKFFKLIVNNQQLEDIMEKDSLFEDNGSNPGSEDKGHSIQRRQLIKKDQKKKDKRKAQPINEKVELPTLPNQQPQQLPNTYSSFQSETSKYQRLDEFWKVDIQSLYRKQFTQEDKVMLSSVLNQQPVSIVDVFKNAQLTIWTQKLSLQALYKYISLVMQFTDGNDDYTFVALENQNKQQHYVLILDQNRHIEKAVQVSEQEMNLLAFRQQCVQNIKKKTDYYNTVLNKNEKLSEVSLELAFLVNYMNWIKNKLDLKLQELDQRAKQQPKSQPPAKVQENYITFLINKNLNKALHDEEIDYYNHFKKLDVNEHVSGLIDAKPIIDKKEFEEYIRKRKIKKTGKKARWVLKTTCGGCLSYYHQLYNPFSFCTECHMRYHKYCYIPKNQGICESCFQSKSNQTKKSRINECQLCGTKGFLYLPMNESGNAHIFCMLINGLWKFQDTQIVFQNRLIENAIENATCSICKQSNSYIYKCECCDHYAHPLCGYLSGWGVKQQRSLQQSCNNSMVKLQCCKWIDRQKNEKRRKFVLNYKKCVFSQCQ